MNQERTNKPGSQTFPDLPNANLERVLDYGVYDRNGQDVGKVTAIWTDHTGQPAFVGVRTSWLFGRTHIVPAYGAHVNHQDALIRLPYLEEEIKNAPNYDPEASLDYNTEQEVFRYYRGHGGRFPEFERRGTQTSAHQPAPESQPAPKGQEAASIRLHEEQVRAGTREVEAGGVRLRKIVRTETVQKPVQVKREDVVVERVNPGEQRPSPEAFKNEERFIPLRREEPVLEKETHVTGEVQARKKTETERQTVSGEARKEDVQVERERRKAA